MSKTNLSDLFSTILTLNFHGNWKMVLWQIKLFAQFYKTRNQHFKDTTLLLKKNISYVANRDLSPLKNGGWICSNTMNLQPHKYQERGNFEDHFISTNN